MAIITPPAPPEAATLQDMLFDLMPKDEWLPLKDLVESLSHGDGHQRPVNKTHVFEIASKFDMRSVGHLVVNRRADGRLWLIDGQHRAYAMLQLGLELAPCSVYEGLTKAQEAEIWVRRNGGSLQARTFDAFRGEMMYDEKAQEIERVVRAAGFFIPSSNKGAWGNARAINSVGTLRDIYDDAGAEGLAAVLTTIRQAWPDERRARLSEVLMGVHIFLAVYRNRMNRERLERRLAETPLDELLRKANALRGLYSSKLNSLIALAIVEVYNYKVRGDLRIDPTLVTRYRRGGVAAHTLLTKGAPAKPAKKAAR